MSTSIIHSSPRGTAAAETTERRARIGKGRRTEDEH